MNSSKTEENRKQERNLPKIEVKTFKEGPGIVKMPADIRGHQLTVPNIQDWIWHCGPALDRAVCLLYRAYWARGSGAG